MGSFLMSMVTADEIESEIGFHISMGPLLISLNMAGDEIKN